MNNAYSTRSWSEMACGYFAVLQTSEHTASEGSAVDDLERNLMNLVVM
jgi:hypothetical protein